MQKWSNVVPVLERYVWQTEHCIIRVRAPIEFFVGCPTRRPRDAWPFFFYIYLIYLPRAPGTSFSIPNVPRAMFKIPYAPKIMTRPTIPHIIALFPSVLFVSSPACATNSNTPQRNKTKATAERSRIIGLTISVTTFFKNSLRTGIYLTLTPDVGTPVGPVVLPKLIVPVR